MTGSSPFRSAVAVAMVVGLGSIPIVPQAVPTALANTNAFTNIALHVNGTPDCNGLDICGVDGPPDVTAPSGAPIVVSVYAHNYDVEDGGGAVGLGGVQTAFQWPATWQFLSSAAACRPLSLPLSVPSGSGGTLGTLAVAFDPVFGGTTVELGFLLMVPGPDGVLEQIPSAFPLGSHVIDQQGNFTALDAARLGAVCAGPGCTGGIDPCSGAPSILGACCQQDGLLCAETSETLCLGIGGEFQGVGEPCPNENAGVTVEPGGQVFTHIFNPSIIGCPSEDLTDDDAQASLVCPPNQLYDAWISPENAQMCNAFGVPGSPAIPADFFDVGSEAFTDSICLKGAPIHPDSLPHGFPDLGDADTIVFRSQDPFDRCELPSNEERTVDIEIIALSLVNIDPIEVIVNGQPEVWDVFVDLSENGSPLGSVTADMTHCNGGTYTNILPVQARFTFTKTSEPDQVRVLDTGVAGIPPVVLELNDPGEWMSHADVFWGPHIDRCSFFHPGFQTQNPVTACDENNNGINDLCENTTAVDDTPALTTPTSTRIMLYPSRPNPFNPSTTIAYDLPSPMKRRLAIYDVAGRQVRVLQDWSVAEAGRHSVLWDGQDSNGGRVSSGVYYSRLETEFEQASQALVVIK